MHPGLRPLLLPDRRAVATTSQKLILRTSAPVLRTRRVADRPADRRSALAQRSKRCPRSSKEPPAAERYDRGKEKRKDLACDVTRLTPPDVRSHASKHHNDDHHRSNDRNASNEEKRH